MFISGWLIIVFAFLWIASLVRKDAIIEGLRAQEEKRKDQAAEKKTQEYIDKHVTIIDPKWY